jgi:hypothetical protein
MNNSPTLEFGFVNGFKIFGGDFVKFIHKADVVIGTVDRVTGGSQQATLKVKTKSGFIKSFNIIDIERENKSKSVSIMVHRGFKIVFNGRNWVLVKGSDNDTVMIG